jgi:hypothetical protein
MLKDMFFLLHKFFIMTAHPLRGLTLIRAVKGDLAARVNAKSVGLGCTRYILWVAEKAETPERTTGYDRVPRSGYAPITFSG